MGLWQRITGWLRPAPPKAKIADRRRLGATYDAASDGADNRRHWQQTDSLSAKSANSLEVRKTLRERARYEDQNNGYCKGMVLTLANDLVGTGPTLQVSTGDKEADKQVEAAWKEWADAVGLGEKLHTMAQSKPRCGEVFALLTTDEDLPTSVKLDVEPVEADRITDPTWNQSLDPKVSDGIEYNDRGKPVAYYVLDEHPGDSFALGRTYKKIPTRSMLHWYRKDRPGQLRGVPEITPSLPLFAQLRRFTLATLTAAEIAANFAAMLETSANPDGETEEPEPFETLEIERGMMTTLPAGSKMNQLKAEHPATTYQMFKTELLKEIGRPVNAPFNVVSGDSSDYNYSSARLDHLLYRGAVRVTRESCRRNVLERIFAAWLEEAIMVPGLLPGGTTPANVPHSWYWPGFSTIDRQKEAAADTEALDNNTTTLAELLAEVGLDWEDVLRQKAREKELMDELGLTKVAPAPFAPPPAAGQQAEPEESDDDETEDEEDTEDAPKREEARA
jgi:lambda family phage portal protein